MSLDGYVFFNRDLRSIADWQRAIDTLGLPLTLELERDPQMLKGHLPARLNGREAGFECSRIAVDDVIRTYDETDFGGPWSSALAFYYGSLSGCVGAWIAIAAWTSATDGVAFDPQRGAVLDAKAAVQYARDGLRSLPDVERRLSESWPNTKS